MAFPGKPVTGPLPPISRTHRCPIDVPPAPSENPIGEFMTKEMIISANVHEKKVAIIEDGVVTEFYVERSDENQGVVGNLYKGRVMKVLPGMQSAFVDIALERDAFLYVSDFAELLEDEEIIEYRDQAESRIDQRPHGVQGRGRRDDRRESDSSHRYAGRSEQRYAPPSRVEALGGRPAQEAHEAGPDPEGLRIQDVVEQLAEIVDERVIEPVPPEEEELLHSLEPLEGESAGTSAALEQDQSAAIETGEGAEAESEQQAKIGEAAAEVEAEGARPGR